MKSRDFLISRKKSQANTFVCGIAATEYVRFVKCKGLGTQDAICRGSLQYGDITYNAISL